MRISTKGSYGLAAMVFLAKRESSHGLTPIITIAKELQISKIYLEQIFSLLKKSQLVESVKGPQGGYHLALKPEEITAEMILTAIESSLFEKIQPFLSESYPHIDHAMDELIWDPLDRKIAEVLQGVSLQQLVDKSDEKREKNQLMFYI